MLVDTSLHFLLVLPKRRSSCCCTNGIASRLNGWEARGGQFGSFADFLLVCPSFAPRSRQPFFLNDDANLRPRGGEEGLLRLLRRPAGQQVAGLRGRRHRRQRVSWCGAFRDGNMCADLFSLSLSSAKRSIGVFGTPQFVGGGVRRSFGTNRERGRANFFPRCGEGAG